MKKIVIAATTCLLMASCGNNQTNAKPETMQSDDSLFDAFKQNFVEDLWKMYPSWAASQGYHKYDSVLVVPNDESSAKELAFCKATSAMLKS